MGTWPAEGVLVELTDSDGFTVGPFEPALSRIGEELARITSVDPEHNLATIERAVRRTVPGEYGAGTTLVYGNPFSEGYHGISAVLAAAVSDTTGELVIRHPNPLPPVPFDVLLNDEIARVTQVVGNTGESTLTVTRGAHGTHPRARAARLGYDPEQSRQRTFKHWHSRERDGAARGVGRRLSRGAHGTHPRAWAATMGYDAEQSRLRA